MTTEKTTRYYRNELKKLRQIIVEKDNYIQGLKDAISLASPKKY